MLAGCGPPKQGLLRFSGGASGALVTIDDQYVGKFGRLKRRGVKLPVGEHRITIEQVGFFPFDRLVIIRADQQHGLEVELTKIPD